MSKILQEVLAANRTQKGRSPAHDIAAIIPERRGIRK
jgi:hypothetical protein